MLRGLKQPLKSGETFPVTLTFKNAGQLRVEVRIGSPQAAMANASDSAGLEMREQSAAG